MKKLLLLIALASAALAMGLAFAQSAKDTFVYQSFGDPDTMDPVQAYDSASGQIIENVYEPLFGYKGDKVDEYEPRLATDYTQSEDGKTFTFTLRQGVKFHSGNDFTCKDVAYSFKRALVTNPADSGAWVVSEPLIGHSANAADELGDSATDADWQAFWDKIDNAVTCTDDYTAVFNLVAPDPAFFAKLLFYAGAIVDSQWAIDNGEWDGTQATWRDWAGVDLRQYYMQDHMSGTGAYELVNWTPGQRVVAKAFDGYWGGAPTIKNVLVQNVTDQNARILALKNGDADQIILGELSALTQVEGLPGVTIYNRNGDLGWSSVAVNAAFLNQDINPADNTSIGSGKLDGNGIPVDFFTDEHVRKCFNYAFDSQAYIEQVLLGLGNTLTMALPPSYLGYDASVPQYSFDEEKATAECKAAWDGQLWDKGMQLTISYNTGNLGRQTTAEILKSNLEYLNPKFKVDVRGIAWPDFLSQRNQRLLPVSVVGWIPDYADPDNYVHTFYASTGYYAARSSFKDPQIDDLDQQARTELNPEVRKFLYSQIGRLGYQDAPFVLLPQQRVMFYMRDNVQGVYDNPMYSGNFLWKDLSKN